MASETLPVTDIVERGDFGISGLRVELAAGASAADVIEGALALLNMAHEEIYGADSTDAPDRATEAGLMMVRLARAALEMTQRMPAATTS